MKSFLKFLDNTGVSNISDDVSSSNLVRQLHSELTYSGSLVIARSECRPDMLSQKLYGTWEYDYILMLYNGLRSHEFTKGTKIKYPTLASINKLVANYGQFKV